MDRTKIINIPIKGSYYHWYNYRKAGNFYGQSWQSSYRLSASIMAHGLMVTKSNGPFYKVLDLLSYQVFISDPLHFAADGYESCNWNQLSLVQVVLCLSSWTTLRGMYKAATVVREAVRLLWRLLCLQEAPLSLLCWVWAAYTISILELQQHSSLSPN